MITFKSVKESSAINIASVTPNSAQFRQLVDESVRRLLPRGDWAGTVVPIQVCITQNGCVVWPRYVGHVRKMNICKSGVEMHNVWYDYLPFSNNSRWNTWWNDNGGYYWNSWFGPMARVVNQARSPVHTNIMGASRNLRAYIDSALDVNKKIRIFGVDDDTGQRLVTMGIGGWTDGIDINFAAPYAELKDRTGTAINIRTIERVVKDVTQGPVRLFAYNTSAAVLEDVAVYDPSETEPDYVRSRLDSACCSSSTRSVLALIKVAYVPIRTDTDLVAIDNLAAIKNMMQSIRSEDDGDLSGKAQWEAAAIRELNLQLGDENPEDQVSVDMGSMGRNGSSIGQQHCF